MAKITARGHREVARWRKDDGQELVFTQQDGKPLGRLLRKWMKGGGFSVVSGATRLDEAEAFADSRGMVRV